MTRNCGKGLPRPAKTIMVSEQYIENGRETSRARIFPKSYARFISIHDSIIAHPTVNELYCLSHRSTMKHYSYLLLPLFAFVMTSCDENKYTVTSSDIEHQQEISRGVHYMSLGSMSDEPFERGISVTGVVGGGIKISAGAHTLSCPNDPGYYYEGRSYVNREGKAYIFANKIPDPDL